MKITKIGHCCLLIEEGDVTLLTDPGKFTTGQNEVTGIDVVLITHEHGDHLHVESLEHVLENNPDAQVITNTSVGKLLDTAGIAYEIVEDGGATKVKDIAIEGHGKMHQEIYKDFGQVQNTGYFIADRFFYPGDAFHNPGKPVDILALPVAGPWCCVKDAVKYAKEIKPKHAFPVHDGQLKIIGGNHGVPAKLLPDEGIEFVALKDGETIEW